MEGRAGMYCDDEQQSLVSRHSAVSAAPSNPWLPASIGKLGVEQLHRTTSAINQIDSDINSKSEINHKTDRDKSYFEGKDQDENFRLMNNCLFLQTF